MFIVGYALAIFTVLAIIAIGLRFLLAPHAAVRGYGFAVSDAEPDAAAPWLMVKGVRDIASGLFLLLVLVAGPARLVGGFMLIASIIPLADMGIVLRHHGSRSTAFAIHGSTALSIIVAGLLLLFGR